MTATALPRRTRQPSRVRSAAVQGLPLAPAFVVFVGLLLIPLADLLKTSFATHIPGAIGVTPRFRFTLQNYDALAHAPFPTYLLSTLELAATSVVIAFLLGYPMAYYIARSAGRRRTLLIGLLIGMLFLNAIVRAYALELTFLTVGPVKDALAAVGIAPGTRAYGNVLVVAGLVNLVIPLVALTLIGPIQNIDPALEEAAETLGASRVASVWHTTVRLSAPGILGAALVAYTIAVSAFVIPLVLGQGEVPWVATMIYSDFSEIANYPAGAATAVALVLIVVIGGFAISRAMKASGRNLV